MALQEIHPWTLGGLIGAFIDLVLAYFLLCGSAIAFFASKFFGIFGICMPCPCKGSFGFRNSNFCMHKILFEWPSRKIGSIQVMAAKRFPYDLVWKKGHSCNANGKIIQEKISDIRLIELEDEASCSSCSGPRFLSLADKEIGYDAKGKRIMSPRRKSVIRRRRRGNYDSGKFSSVFPSENLQSDVSPASCLSYDGNIMRDKTYERVNPASEKEACLPDAETGHDVDERTCDSYEFSGSMVNTPGQDKYSYSLDNYTSNAQDKAQFDGNVENRIKMLEYALEKEKAAYTALYLELEKERAAAATAADEAMAMISRLQEQKASMEMETRQFQRMIEEIFAFDEEEMNILQEILIRRERENYFLEKELDAFRQMGFRGSDQSNGQSKVQLDDWGERPPVSLERHVDPLQIESTMSIVKRDEISNVSSSLAKTVISTEDVEDLEKNTEHKDQDSNSLHSSSFDTEPDVLDVHVIDDNIELRENENEIEKISSASVSTVLEETRNNYPELWSLAVQSNDVMSDCPRTSKTESNPWVDGLTNQSSMFCVSRCENWLSDSGWDSSCADNNEKLKIGTEIEILERRLRMVQHEKEKLSSFAELGENEKGWLKLLEDIANQILQIKQLRNPMRGASLPPSSAKVSLRKRRCQSES